MGGMQGLDGLDLSVTPYDGCGKCFVAVLRLSQMTDTTNSPDKQVKQNRQAVDAFGGHIIAWAEDWDVSGATSAFVRKGFGPWLNDQRGPYDGISASAVDRIGRDLLDTLTVGRHMTTTGRYILTYGHPGPWDLTNQLDEQNFTFQALGAQMELRSTQRRSSQTAENMRESGRKIGLLAHGYRYVRIGESRVIDHIALDPYVHAYLNDVADQLLADESGLVTCSSEARRMTQAGILTSMDYRRKKKGLEPVGAAWDGEALRDMLMSPAMLGYLMHQREPVNDTSSDPKRRGRPIKVAPEISSFAAACCLPVPPSTSSWRCACSAALRARGRRGIAWSCETSAIS